VDEWLSRARAQLARAVGDGDGDYELSAGDEEKLLELARIAAHESGQRTNAPLLAYLVGLAHGRHSDRGLAELADEATRTGQP